MIWHAETGAGPAVLLLHAGVADARMRDREWDAWAGRFRLLRCDLAGYGNTPVPSDGILRPAEDIAAVLDHLQTGPTAVVGASFGGAVTLELAVTRPDLVRRLVLVAAGLPGHDWSAGVRAFGEREDAAIAAGDLDGAVQANLEAWVAGPQRTLADVDPAVTALVAEMQRRAFELQAPVWDDLEDGRREGFADRLGEIAVPVLAVTGELDQPDFAVIVDRIAAAVPGARHVSIAGAAHLPSLEQPARFDELVLPLLAA